MVSMRLNDGPGRAGRLKQRRLAGSTQRHRGRLLCLLLAPWFAVAAPIPKPAPAPAPVQPQGPRDPLGRTTPRGTVLGFLAASQNGSDHVAVEYLNTRLRGTAASELAHQLYYVLDRRLPAKLQKLSDAPEGSLSDALKPNQDLVGTIASLNGAVDILVERVNRGTAGEIWLFSPATLSQIPALYEEADLTSVEDILPAFLLTKRLAGVPLFQFVAFFAGLPLLYMAAVFATRLLNALAGRLARYISKKPDLPNPKLFPAPVRLLVLPVVIYWTISRISLPLLARQFWTAAAAVITIAACVWLFIVCNGRSEGYLRRRLEESHSTGATSVVRVARRMVDFLAIFIGLLVLLRYFGVNASAALAGLGVGGIAVALAAQKTLENVIGGFSIIFDKAVHVGEFLKCGDTSGTVEEIGLRSTRIRTSDRTVVSIPNGQIANLSLEDISCRDKFWFRHIIGLRYDTTAAQMRTVLEELHRLLEDHPMMERESVRAGFVRFGTSSLDVELCAYVCAKDSSQFLEVQSAILLRVMELVQAAGTHVALQTAVITSSESTTPGERRGTGQDPGAEQAPTGPKGAQEVMRQTA